MSDFANKLSPLYPIEYVCTVVVYAQIMYVLISSIDLKSKKKKVINKVKIFVGLLNLRRINLKRSLSQNLISHKSI